MCFRNQVVNMFGFLKKKKTYKNDYDIEEIFNHITTEYYNSQDEAISIKLDRYLSKFDDKTSDTIRKEFYIKLTSGLTGNSGVSQNSFEIEMNELYKKFISSKDINDLSSSIKILKQRIEYSKDPKNKGLVLPRNFTESFFLELDHLEYGLKHWENIKSFINTSSNKQIDIQKSLNLDKQKLSTFFYMMDKLGFVSKETIKNRVYIKNIKDSK